MARPRPPWARAPALSKKSGARAFHLVGLAGHRFPRDLPERFRVARPATVISPPHLVMRSLRVCMSCGSAQGVLLAWLIFYGIGLGLTHTPAALLLADAVEHEQGRAKEAVNAIWNTMWEAHASGKE